MHGREPDTDSAFDTFGRLINNLLMLHLLSAELTLVRFEAFLIGFIVIRIESQSARVQVTAIAVQAACSFLHHLFSCKSIRFRNRFQTIALHRFLQVFTIFSRDQLPKA